MAVTHSGDTTPHGPSLEFQDQCIRAGRTPKSNQSVQYDRARKMVEAGKLEAAYEVAKHSKAPEIENLAAVVLMRMGRPKEAVSILRRLALLSNSIDFRPDIPLHFKTNLITALFISGKVGGCLDLTNNACLDDSPQLTQLLANIKRWEKSLSWWKWFDWKICGIEHQETPISLDFEPGEFED